MSLKWLKKGQALVEMMVGLGIAAAIMPAVVTSFFAARGGSAQEEVRMMASGRLREAREVLRLVKNDNWAVIADGETINTYHPVLSSNVWNLTSGSESNLDGLFTRQILIGPAYRTLTNQLTTISAGNTLDPSVKHVSITVSWTTPIASSVESSYYIMRLENLTYLETLLSDFTATGVVHRSTLVTNTSGGEIVLGGSGSGIGDWCNPGLGLPPLNLYHSSVPTSLTAIEGHAYATTGENASGDPLVSITITNPPSPSSPTASDSASYNPNPPPKAYGLYADTNYIYIATSKNMVRILNPNLTDAGYFDVGNNVGDTVFVSGTVGYATSGTTLYSFNLAGTINPAPQLATATLAGSSKRIVVVGDYVYVVTSSTTKQLQIFDKSTLVEVGSGLNVGNSRGGIDVYVKSGGDYAYLVTADASPDFFVIDLANKSAPSVVGTYATPNMVPTGVTVIPQDHRAIVVGSGSDIYQVLRINVPASPTRCSGTLTFPGVTAINAISSVTESDSDAYSYILTNDASNEFQMIKGGPGGGGGGSALVGVFDSQPFTPASSATFNRFDVNVTFPAGTYARYQVAVTNQVGGSCAGASYLFVGPDKDPTQWFTGSSQIPLGSATGYSNPGQCFKYRVSLSTDNLGTTPVFNDITVNYSL